MMNNAGMQLLQTEANVKNYKKGDVIVADGTRPEEMYVLLAGSASVFKNYGKFNQQEIAALKIGGIFGEGCLFLHRETEGTLVAQADAQVLHVDEKNYAEPFARRPEMLYGIIAQLVRRLDSVQRSLDQYSGKDKKATIDTGMKKSELFPEAHEAYQLNLTNDRTEFVYKNKVTCPLCGEKFETLSVLGSRLRRESTDRDLRVHYAGVEPMYYDIISCPRCLYSAPTELFPTALPKFKEPVEDELRGFLGQSLVKQGMERDSLTVFAGYYLAIRCVPLCFDEYQTAMGAMWQKLSRIYKDCGNEEMYLYASSNAAKNYEYVYQNFRISENQSQQICYILGDLFERQKNYDKARNFFFMAKANRGGTPVMKMQADRRLEEIRELIKK
jgi:uncharacterized protein (DUF2225 family)